MNATPKPAPVITEPARNSGPESAGIEATVPAIPTASPSAPAAVAWRAVSPRNAIRPRPAEIPSANTCNAQPAT